MKRVNIKSKNVYRTKWFCICFALSFDMKCCIWKPLYEILFLLPSQTSHRYKLLPLLLCLVLTLIFLVHPLWEQNHYLYEHSVLLRMIKRRFHIIFLLYCTPKFAQSYHKVLVSNMFYYDVIQLYLCQKTFVYFIIVTKHQICFVLSTFCRWLMFKCLYMFTVY